MMLTSRVDDGEETDKLKTTQQYQQVTDSQMTRSIWIGKRLGPEDRKQSSSDLQSRLKTRKLLGVGELVGDNGNNIYRSKISQMLGINENLYVKLPRGLLYWHSLNALYLYTAGFLCVVVPRLGGALELPSAGDAQHVQQGQDGDHTVDVDLFRLYGVALIAYALLLRGQLLVRDARGDIAQLLSACALLCALQLTGFCLR